MIASVVLWVLAVEVAGLAVLPAGLRLLRALPDRGYGLSKVLGLLVLAYLLWLGGMLGILEYRQSTAVVVLLVLAAACWWRWGAEALAWLRARRGLVATEEAIFLGAGLLAGLIRAYNADIVGQEKFMDLAFFNAFLSSPRLPPEDAWLAGYAMPYYPFGYFLVGVPARLAGLPAAYGYNLALVLVFALTVLGSAALVAGLVALLGRAADGDQPPGASDWAFGLVGGAFVAVCGNLVGPLEVLAARGIGGSAFWSAIDVKNLGPAPAPTGWLPSDPAWWWQASRVISTIRPDGITEFPFFSYLLGDLHPHFVALPLLLLIVGLALAVLLEPQPRRDPTSLLLTALALGVPIAANTWDVATFWTLYALAALLAGWRVARRQAGPVWRPLVAALAPLPLGVALFAPYFVGYTSQPLGIGLVGDHTPLVSLLLIFGPFFLLVALLALRSIGPLRGLGDPVVGIFLGWMVLGVAFAATGRVSAGLALALLALVLAAGTRQVGAWLAAPDGARTAVLYLLGLAGLALAIVVAVELVFLRDSFGTRMNTVFKFYYHVWLLLALAGAPALALWLARTALGKPAGLSRAAAGLVLLGVLGLGLVYPLGATWTKSGGFRGPVTLDGAAFLRRSRPDDAAAIGWLAARSDRPVVLEAVGGDYQEFARVSTFSGLPTVLGWVGHELQWRGPLDEYNRRQQDVEAVYRRADHEQALRILDRYHVRYVFFGSLERETYGSQAEQRLGGWLSPVFRQGGTTIFVVPTQGDRS